jgi:hypothetical protein
MVRNMAKLGVALTGFLLVIGGARADLLDPSFSAFNPVAIQSGAVFNITGGSLTNGSSPTVNFGFSTLGSPIVAMQGGVLINITQSDAVYLVQSGNGVNATVNSTAPITAYNGSSAGTWAGTSRQSPGQPAQYASGNNGGKVNNLVGGPGTLATAPATGSFFFGSITTTDLTDSIFFGAHINFTIISGPNAGQSGTEFIIPGGSGTGGPPPPVVPEPASMVLLGLGAVGLAGYGYRRRR